GANVREAAVHLLFRNGHAGNGLLRVVVSGDHQVEDLSALERIVNEMALRPGPKSCCVPTQIRGHSLRRDERPEAGVPWYDRRACARSTAGIIAASSFRPCGVSSSNLMRLSSGVGRRWMSSLLSRRSSTSPMVDLSKAITAERRVA